jgi:Putative addiction module component
MSVADLLEEALRLPPSSRASLVEKIVESIAADITPEVERSHLSAVAKRRKSAASRPEEIIPGDQVMEQARRLLRR